MLRYRRDVSPTAEIPVVSKTTIQGPWNANVRSRYVELVLVVDNQGRRMR
jgi:hypothetical protein